MMVRFVIGTLVYQALMMSCVLSVDVESICGPETDTELIETIHNARHVASDWLIGRRERHFGWPKGNTAAAVTSLQLANASSSRNESLEMQSTFKQLHLEILSLVSQAERSRLSNSGVPGRHHQTTIDRLPYYIMALNATCQNATDFHGIDLVSMLTMDMRRFHKTKLKGYYQQALGVLAMCSTGHPVKRRYIEDLLNGQGPNGCYERPCTTSTCGSSESIDTTSIVLSALSCVHRTHIHRDNDLIGASIEDAVDCLLQSHQNGSFGNVVNNAMAAQGLLAAEVNDSRWDCHGTMRKVLDAMHGDGHFGGLATTIHILPLLAGRHHRHIKELEFECPEEYHDSPVPDLEPFGSCQLLRIMLQVSTDDGDTFYQVDGAQGESLLDLMHREQQVSSLGFTFETKTTDWGEYITSINGVDNDEGAGQHWIIEKMEGGEAQCIDKGAGDIYPEYLDRYVWIHRTCSPGGGASAMEGVNNNENAE